MKIKVWGVPAGILGIVVGAILLILGIAGVAHPTGFFVFAGIAFALVGVIILVSPMAGRGSRN